jgi:hypothetical protein
MRINARLLCFFDINQIRMNTALWVMQALLFLFFLAPAIIKLTSTRRQLINKKMLANDGRICPIRAMGMVDLLAAIGVTVPLLFGILPVLTPIAAIGTSLVMAGAFFFHSKRREYKVLPFVFVAFIFSVIIAFYRFESI